MSELRSFQKGAVSVSDRPLIFVVRSGYRRHSIDGAAPPTTTTTTTTTTAAAAARPPAWLLTVNSNHSPSHHQVNLVGPENCDMLSSCNRHKGDMCAVQQLQSERKYQNFYNVYARPVPRSALVRSLPEAQKEHAARTRLGSLHTFTKSAASLAAWNVV